jgi:glc operon protein GlcG
VAGIDDGRAVIEDRLPTRPFLTLAVAQELVAASLAEAEKRELNRMVVAVADAGGRLVAFARQDDAEPAAVDICVAKARTAAIFTRATKAWKQRLLSGDTWVLGMPNMHPIEGGQNIVAAGHTIGGLGIGGATGEIDSEIGIAALAAVLGQAS